MKIVILSSVCYPRVSPRSIRATELAKQLASQGHDVTLYAVLGKTDYTDYCKKYGVKIKNLGKSWMGNIDSDGYTNDCYLIRVFNKLFGKLMWTPDREYIPWVKKAIRAEGNIDLLISIAIPHIIHYAVAKSDLSKVRKWIADCGDPFTLNPFFSLPSFYRKYEFKWCQKCDYITIPISEAKDGYYKEFHDKIVTIPQGYDFDSIKLEEYCPNKVPTFCFAGIAHRGLRDPSNFLQYLTTLNSEFQLIVYTSPNSIFEQYAEKLGGKMIIKERVQREELLNKLSTMDFLINIQNESSIQMPSKLVDYALTKRPILNISSIFDDDERSAFDAFLAGDYTKSLEVQGVENYNIKRVAKQFLDLV